MVDVHGTWGLRQGGIETEGLIQRSLGGSAGVPNTQRQPWLSTPVQLYEMYEIRTDNV
jgi:hypothetical protein